MTYMDAVLTQMLSVVMMDAIVVQLVLVVMLQQALAVMVPRTFLLRRSIQARNEGCFTKKKYKILISFLFDQWERNKCGVIVFV